VSPARLFANVITGDLADQREIALIDPRPLAAAPVDPEAWSNGYRFWPSFRDFTTVGGTAPLPH
jgi:hypothetical protein